MAYGPCMCGSPDCSSCGPAQGWHVHSRRCVGEDGLSYECGQRSYAEAEYEAREEAEDEAGQLPARYERAAPQGRHPGPLRERAPVT